MLNKAALIKRIYDGVRGVAFKVSFSHEQASEFLQEGLVAALEAIDHYPDKSEDELVLLIARSAYNRITTIRGREIQHSQRFSTDVDSIPEPASVEEADYDERQFTAVLCSRLSSLGKRILRERLNPSKRVLEIVDSERKAKLAARAAGKLVMNVHSSKITDTHLAQYLGVSKATVSREIKSIQEAASTLLSD